MSSVSRRVSEPGCLETVIITAGGVATLHLRGFDDAGHLIQQHRALAASLDHDFFQVVQIRDATERADQQLGSAGVEIAAGRVGVAAPERRLDVRQRHVVLQQRLRIHQHLELLPPAPHRDDLRDSGNRQQTLPYDPIGERAHFDRTGRASFAMHADDENLAHDRSHGRHLRADSLGETIRRQRNLFRHDLAINVDIGPPSELDVHDGQTDAGRAAHRLHARRAVQRRLERKSNQRFNFFRRETGRLGHDGDARAV
jgi:hypothetical protein